MSPYFISCWIFNRCFNVVTRSSRIGCLKSVERALYSCMRLYEAWKLITRWYSNPSRATLEYAKELLIQILYSLSARLMHARVFHKTPATEQGRSSHASLSQWWWWWKMPFACMSLRMPSHAICKSRLCRQSNIYIPENIKMRHLLFSLREKNERLQILNSKVINCMKCIEKWTKLCSNLLWDISFSLLNGLVDACINKCCWCSISLEEKCSRCDESCARCCCWYIIHKLSILLGCQDAIEGGCQHVTPLSLDDTMLQSSFSWYMQSMFGQKTNDRQE